MREREKYETQEELVLDDAFANTPVHPLLKGRLSAKCKKKKKSEE